MRRRRTIYFNDARHYYLFVHEPPMRLADAREPVTEVAGTGVDTLIYGVARDDGLFYPSKRGLRFGADRGDAAFAQAAYWRVWHNMQSLLDRGLDPLGVLIDAAHDRDMEFIASLRMGGHPGLPPELAVANGGRGLAEARVRDFQLGLVQELLTDYDSDGVEFDFAAAPGGTGWWFPPDEAEALAPELTAFVRQAAAAARAGDRAKALGARVYPTRALNRRAGLEVEAWLEEGLVDYVVPMLYLCFVLDTQMPIGWLVDAAHAADVSVYAMLQPYDTDETRPLGQRRAAPAPLLRAAAANAWAAGVDGLYTWFLPWPLGAAERAVLTELSSPGGACLAGRDKRYRARRASPPAQECEFDYPAPLPARLSAGDQLEVPLTVADDLRDPEAGWAGAVRLHLGITDLTTADRIEVRLNGQPLAAMPARRRPLRDVDPYAGQWLDIDVAAAAWPQAGDNTVTIILHGRPEGLEQRPLVLEDLELSIDFDTYAATGPVAASAERKA